MQSGIDLSAFVTADSPAPTPSNSKQTNKRVQQNKPVFSSTGSLRPPVSAVQTGINGAVKVKLSDTQISSGVCLIRPEACMARNLYTVCKAHPLEIFVKFLDLSLL